MKPFDMCINDGGFITEIYFILSMKKRKNDTQAFARYDCSLFSVKEDSSQIIEIDVTDDEDPQYNGDHGDFTCQYVSSYVPIDHKRILRLLGKEVFFKSLFNFG